jgi:hypothetical protein
VGLEKVVSFPAEVVATTVAGEKRKSSVCSGELITFKMPERKCPCLGLCRE